MNAFASTLTRFLYCDFDSKFVMRERKLLPFFVTAKPYEMFGKKKFTYECGFTFSDSFEIL